MTVSHFTIKSEGGNTESVKRYYGSDEAVKKSASASPQINAMTQPVWFGKDAERLGLTGVGKDKEWHQIIDGFIPGTNLGIKGEGKRKGHKDNCIFDVTATAPKSISMQIEIGKDHRLYAAYQDTVLELAELIQRDYAIAQDQTKGKCQQVETNGIIAMLIPHHTSRAGDPNTHTHIAIANGTYREDGKWRALLDRPLRRSRFVGDYFDSRLKMRVEALGYETRSTVSEKGAISWELADVTDAQCKHFSKRSNDAEALALMKEKGISKSEALLRTRPEKDTEKTLEEYQAEWLEEGKTIGFTGLEHPKIAIKPKESETAAEVLESAIRHYSYHSTHFTRDNIREYAFKTPKAFSIEQLDTAIAQHTELINYGTGKTLQPEYTTAHALEREIKTVKSWMAGEGKASPVMRRAEAEAILEAIPLKAGQHEAIVRTLESANQHQIIHGLSGVGKTRSLRALKAIYDQKGIEVLGFAPSHEAADKLSQELGIATDTVQKLVKDSSYKLKKNQVLFVDEGGLGSADMMLTLIEKANAVGARIILVGDTGQNQAVEAGSPMRSLMKHGAETHDISQIIRQQNEVQRNAVELIANGDGVSALKLLVKNDYVSEISDLDILVNQIADAFMALSPKEQADTLVISGTNAGKDAIAAEIRSRLKAEGRLGESAQIKQLRDKKLSPEEARFVDSYDVGDYLSPLRNFKKVGLVKDLMYEVVGKSKDLLTLRSAKGHLHYIDPKHYLDKQIFTSRSFDVAVGDELRWTKGNALRGQKNGDKFKITAIKNGIATIEVNGKTELLNLKDPVAVDYTLVSTSYRVQGSDRPRVFVLATNDPTSNREPFYVSISRQIKELKIWTPDLKKLQDRVAESSVQKNPLELLEDYFNDYSNTITARAPDRSGSPGLGEDRADFSRAFRSESGESRDRTDGHRWGRGDLETAKRAWEESYPRYADRGEEHGRNVNRELNRSYGGLDPTHSDFVGIEAGTRQNLAEYLFEESYRARVLSELAEPLANLRSALEELREVKRLNAALQDSINEKMGQVLTQVKMDILETALEVRQQFTEQPISAQTAVDTALEAYQTAIAPPKPKIIKPFWAPIYPDKPPEHISQKHWDEFKKSCIHPDLIAANAESMQGVKVFNYLLSDALGKLKGNAAQYATAPVQELLSRYSKAAEGGWWGRGGIDALSLKDIKIGEKPRLNDRGCFKPDSPRLDVKTPLLKYRYAGKVGKEEKQVRAIAEAASIAALLQAGINPNKFIAYKPRKYEHPEGQKRSLYLPIVPDSLAGKIYQKYNIQPTAAEKAVDFWYVVRAYNLPITVTEGAKKTWASLSQGVVTIGVSGVNGTYQANDHEGNKLEMRQLNEELAVFATPGRRFTFAYDNDPKTSTIFNVRREMVRAVELLEKEGCPCDKTIWKGDKGLDDLIYAQGPKAYTQAQASSVSCDKDKATHYRTEYGKVARRVRKVLPDLSQAHLEMQVYVRTITGGESKDGDRFVSESDKARELRKIDPALATSYLEIIRNNAEQYIDYVKEGKSKEELEQFVSQAVENKTSSPNAEEVRTRREYQAIAQLRTKETKLDYKSRYENLVKWGREKLGVDALQIRVDAEVWKEVIDKGTVSDGLECLRQSKGFKREGEDYIKSVASIAVKSKNSSSKVIRPIEEELEEAQEQKQNNELSFS
jgi:conjugative relaxase-like TrwC/TraI family protein